ncbi:MAG: STAS domain-containing protein [Rufibacter sp.]
MVTQTEIDAIFSLNPEFGKYFLLKNLNLNEGEFLYIALKEDSTGKDLESILLTLDKFYDGIIGLSPKNIVFSFKKVEYFGDLGLAVTIRLFTAIEEKGGRVVILEPKPKIRNVIEILGLDKYLEICETEEGFLEER